MAAACVPRRPQRVGFRGRVLKGGKARAKRAGLQRPAASYAPAARNAIRRARQKPRSPSDAPSVSGSLHSVTKDKPRPFCCGPRKGPNARDGVERFGKAAAQRGLMLTDAAQALLAHKSDARAQPRDAGDVERPALQRVRQEVRLGELTGKAARSALCDAVRLNIFTA